MLLLLAVGFPAAVPLLLFPLLPIPTWTPGMEVRAFRMKDIMLLFPPPLLLGDLISGGCAFIAFAGTACTGADNAVADEVVAVAVVAGADVEAAVCTGAVFEVVVAGAFCDGAAAAAAAAGAGAGLRRLSK